MAGGTSEDQAEDGGGQQHGHRAGVVLGGGETQHAEGEQRGAEGERAAAVT